MCIPLALISGTSLLGSIPTSYLVGRLVAGVDLREHGSRNLGATNVFRVLGWNTLFQYCCLTQAKAPWRPGFSVPSPAPSRGCRCWSARRRSSVTSTRSFSSSGAEGVATAAGPCTVSRHRHRNRGLAGHGPRHRLCVSRSCIAVALPLLHPAGRPWRTLSPGRGNCRPRAPHHLHSPSQYSAPARWTESRFGHRRRRRRRCESR